MSFTVSLIIVLALAVLFGWLASRAWRVRRAVVKWPGVIGAGLLATLCVVIGVIALLGLYKLSMPAPNPAPDIQVARSPEQLARGERLAHLCVLCHSSSGELPLDGGAENITPELGVLYAPNLTPGGSLKEWSDGEIVRAIREGVDQSGRPLRIMPSDQYHLMSDADVQALVAYLRTQPSVDRQTPEAAVNLLGAVVVGLGVFPLSVQPSLNASVEAPPVGPAPEYGQYLVTISGCGACHGDDLRGGINEFVPIGPNLPVLISQWSASEFIQTIRTGIDPYGHPVNPETMPWPAYSAAYTDEELQAIYEYIRSLSLTVNLVE